MILCGTDMYRHVLMWDRRVYLHTVERDEHMAVASERRQRQPSLPADEQNDGVYEYSAVDPWCVGREALALESAISIHR